MLFQPLTAALLLAPSILAYDFTAADVVTALDGLNTYVENLIGDIAVYNGSDHSFVTTGFALLDISFGLDDVATEFARYNSTPRFTVNETPAIYTAAQPLLNSTRAASASLIAHKDVILNTSSASTGAVDGFVLQQMNAIQANKNNVSENIIERIPAQYQLAASTFSAEFDGPIQEAILAYTL